MHFKRLLISSLALISVFTNLKSEVKGSEFFPTHASNNENITNTFSLKTNILPWITVTPNIGVEFAFENKWSTDLDVLFSPWKISNKYSVKTIAILPEIRYWFRDNSGGSYINLHFSAAWYNVRFNRYRYQDNENPLLGVGLGYGYRVHFSPKFGMEFTIGAGFASLHYNRFYNTANGALVDTRKTVYWGIDRIGISLVYNISNL